MLPILKKAVKYVNSEIMFPRRYNFLSQELSPYLEGCQSLLDVGSSNGKLVKKLSENLGKIELAGVDINVQPGSVIPILEYDGKTLPYADASFDCVMFIDVLHHTEDPERLIQEAKRVSKKNILIKDHYWKNKIDWTILKWADYMGNDPFNITLPYNYLKEEAWNAIFDRADLKVVNEKLFTKYSFDPCKHVIYNLEKTANA